MRLRGYADDVPKPMVQIGTRPILWHLMKYYAHFGHKDFILCLGYKGNSIKDYFLHYDESVSNDFVWSKGGTNVQFLNRDIDDWTITFVETGVNANIGQRLKAIEPHVQGEEMFLANYGDGLSDVPLPALLERFRESKAIASLLLVQPTASFDKSAGGESEGSAGSATSHSWTWPQTCARPGTWPRFRHESLHPCFSPIVCCSVRGPSVRIINPWKKTVGLAPAAARAGRWPGCSGCRRLECRPRSSAWFSSPSLPPRMS